MPLVGIERDHQVAQHLARLLGQRVAYALAHG
jgi:hypothetical protein